LRKSISLLSASFHAQLDKRREKMSQFAIEDLSFLEIAISDEREIEGSGIDTPNLTPSISIALSTAADTRSLAGYNITGNALDGFSVNLLTLGSAAAAGAAALSIGGKATAFTFTMA
jgi:uncharacterized membrane protein